MGAWCNIICCSKTCLLFFCCVFTVLSFSCSALSLSLLVLCWFSVSLSLLHSTFRGYLLPDQLIFFYNAHYLFIQKRTFWYNRYAITTLLGIIEYKTDIGGSLGAQYSTLLYPQSTSRLAQRRVGCLPTRNPQKFPGMKAMGVSVECTLQACRYAAVITANLVLIRSNYVELSQTISSQNYWTRSNILTDRSYQALSCWVRLCLTRKTSLAQSIDQNAWPTSIVLGSI